MLAKEPEREKKDEHQRNQIRDQSLRRCSACRFTDGPNDSFLQLPLLVSFDDLGPDVCAAVIRTRQLIIHTQAELLDQSVKDLQDCGTCKHHEHKL